jgi:pimeloyl-ACP methyl ester carboxylesterase
MKDLAILMLPGMMLDRRIYAGQFATLADRGDIVFGDISRADSIGAIATQVLDAAPERFALVGLSMGGIIAFEIWRQAAHRVTHLALIGTTPYGDSPARRPSRVEQIAQVQSAGLRQVLLGMMPSYISGEGPITQRMASQVLDMGLSLGPEVFRRQSIALRDRPDSCATLARITCPTLIACGRDDALCPVHVHVSMAAAIPNSDLMVFANCGHLASLHAPAALSSGLSLLLNRESSNVRDKPEHDPV